jgi:hypothetical protein
VGKGTSASSASQSIEGACYDKQPEEDDCEGPHINVPPVKLLQPSENDEDANEKAEDCPSVGKPEASVVPSSFSRRPLSLAYLRIEGRTTIDAKLCRILILFSTSSTINHDQDHRLKKRSQVFRF